MSVSGDGAASASRPGGPLDTIEEAIAEYRAGRMVIVMDDEDRENEGDLCMAAEKVTPEAINFMATEGRGLICLPLTGRKLLELGLPMMVAENTAPLGTAFTVSIDARRGIGSGVSAADRARTILAAVASKKIRVLSCFLVAAGAVMCDSRAGRAARRSWPRR